MIKCINFKDLQVKLLLNGLITQTVLHYNDDTAELKKGQVVPVCFENELYKDKALLIMRVKRTGICKLTNADCYDNGFLYKPHFLQFLQDKGFTREETILAVDFRLIDNEMEEV